MGFHWTVFIIGMALSLCAQALVQANVARYSRVMAMSGLTGAQAARQTLDVHGLGHIRIEHARGQLTDHFSPREGVLRLSDTTYGQSSVAAIGIALHEVGHAIQHQQGYWPNKFRTALLLPANLGSQIGPLMAIIGLFMQLAIGDTIMYAGIFLFAFAVLFYLITLPVEFNASHRAMQLIDERGYLTGDQRDGAKRVLRAAAMTYVASAVTAGLYLLRYISLASSRRQ